MAEETGIAWAHSTYNPWIGCTKIAPECDECYAAAADIRFHAGSHWGAGAPRYRTTNRYLLQPNLWNQKAKAKGEPWRVFCASQADVFDNEVDPTWRAQLWHLIKTTPYLTWLLLTKRIGNASDMLPMDWEEGYPNVWLGITTGTQKAFDRDWPKLAQVPARVRWLSIEPQLESVRVRPAMSAWGALELPDWIVTGGENAPSSRARPYHLEWAEDLLYQSRKHGMYFFMKQLGVNAYLRSEPYPHTGKGDEIAEWPDHLRVREFPRALPG